MYFTPRGLNEQEQRILDCSTSQRFLELVISNKSIPLFFKKHGIKTIAIAGASHFGKCLVNVLKGSNISVCCFVDKMYYRYTNGQYMGIPIVSYSEIGKDRTFDAIVVASNYYFNEITDQILESGIPLECILNINDILFGVE